MSFDTVRALAEARMATLDSPPVAYDNVHFDARSTDTWARVVVEPADSFNKSMAADYEIRHVGVVIVTLHTRARLGAAPLMTIADTVSGLFSNSRSGAVWFDQAAIQRLGEIDEVYQINVSIPYTYDEVSS